MKKRKPDAWMHTMTYETGEQHHRVSLSAANAWGRPGRDYSETYPVTADPLYRRTDADRAWLLEASESVKCLICTEVGCAKNILAAKLREMAS